LSLDTVNEGAEVTSVTLKWH